MPTGIDAGELRDEVDRVADRAQSGTARAHPGSVASDVCVLDQHPQRRVDDGQDRLGNTDRLQRHEYR